MAAIRSSRADAVFDVVDAAVLTVVLAAVAYPLLYIVSSSFSSVDAIYGGRVWLLPVGFSLKGYRVIFEYAAVWRAYGNTIFYATVGTAVNVTLTVMAGYALSRRDFGPRRIYMLLLAFTMIFSGGLIPTYMLISSLGLINTRWVMIIPNALIVWNVVITRTFFESTIPDELLEAARMDGCDDLRFLGRIVLPLSSAILAVNSIFYAVGHWNAFFNAFLYLNDERLFPLQLVLRKILIVNAVDAALFDDAESMEAREGLRELLKYSLIIVSSVPVLCLYPFAQRYFVKGVMVGSIKG